MLEQVAVPPLWPLAGTAFCSTRTSPQSVHFEPSVRPSSVHVAALAAKVSVCSWFFGSSFPYSSPQVSHVALLEHVAVPPACSATSPFSPQTEHTRQCSVASCDQPSPQVWPSLTVTVTVAELPALSAATTFCSPAAGESVKDPSSPSSTAVPFTVTEPGCLSATVAFCAAQ